MKILITGIGITGKSTLRRLLVRKLREFRLLVKQYDADRFVELRDSTDMDCLKVLPGVFQKDVVYLIEDIHGFLPSATLPLESYDLTLYLRTDIFSHLMFWLSRSWVWLKNGRFSWGSENGWLGTGRVYDIRNIVPIFETALHDFRNRKRWISEDLKSISPFPHIVVHSKWTCRGIKFTVF